VRLLGDSTGGAGLIYFFVMDQTVEVAVGLDELFAKACPTKEDAPFFNHCMSIAKARGLAWKEALEYTIEMRGERR
jgi:hypothetical protein